MFLRTAMEFMGPGETPGIQALSTAFTVQDSSDQAFLVVNSSMVFVSLLRMLLFVYYIRCPK
jgi:hypothetical protein